LSEAEGKNSWLYVNRYRMDFFYHVIYHTIFYMFGKVIIRLSQFSNTMYLTKNMNLFPQLIQRKKELERRREREC